MTVSCTLHEGSGLGILENHRGLEFLMLELGYENELPLLLSGKTTVRFAVHFRCIYTLRS
jgi:hypothetical protein